MAIFKQQDPCIFLINHNLNIGIIIFPHIDNNLQDTIVPFRKDFSPSGEQLEHCKLAHEL